MSVVSPTSRFAYKSIRLHQGRFAYRRKSFRLHDLSRFAYIQVFSPTLCSKIFCQDRWTSLPIGKTASSLAVSLFELFSQQPTSTFLHPYFGMRKLKYSLQDQQKPFSEFQQVAAVETCDKFRYKSFLKPCLYSTRFTFIAFVLKLVVACSFWVARIIKNTLRKPFEFKWPEVRFNRKQTSIIDASAI